MTDIILDIKQLTRRFGAFTAVDGLSLTVNAGEIFGLLGSNGAGKTTPIKMLTTLLPPRSGEVLEAGFSILSQSENVRYASVSRAGGRAVCGSSHALAGHCGLRSLTAAELRNGTDIPWRH